MNTEMSMLRRLLGLSLVVVFLSGCAQQMVLPSAEKLSDADAAIFVVDKSSVTDDGRPTLNALWAGDGTALITAESFQDFDRIKVAPGMYYVQLKIYSANYMPSFPQTKVSAEAGNTYVFSSAVIMDGRAVTADYSVVPTASYVPPQ